MGILGMNFFAQLLITTAYVSTCIHYFWITSSGRKAIFIQCYIMVSTWWPHYPSINVLLASITLFKTIKWIGLFHPDSFQWSIWNFACSRLSIQLKCVYVPLLQAFLVSMVDQSADPKATFEALGRWLFSMEEQSSLSVSFIWRNRFFVVDQHRPLFPYTQDVRDFDTGKY